MQKIILLAGLIFISNLLLAQVEADTIDIEKKTGKIKVFIDEKEDLGIFGSILYGLHPQPNGYGPNGRIEGGILYNRFLAGAFYAGYDGDLSRRLIFPNLFTIEYEHAGIFIGYRLLKKPRYQIFGRLSYSRGFIQWTPTTGLQEDYFRDDVAFIQPEVQFEFTFLRFIRFMASLGYKMSNDFYLPQLESKDLDGVFFLGGLKFGWFKKRKL